MVSFMAESKSLAVTHMILGMFVAAMTSSTSYHLASVKQSVTIAVRWPDQIRLRSGSNLPSGAEEQFHYFWPWVIFCGVGLLICFYYWVEARKRFVKSKPLIKYMFDRYLNWLAIICFIGIPIDLARAALDPYFFAWR